MVLLPPPPRDLVIFPIKEPASKLFAIPGYDLPGYSKYKLSSKFSPLDLYSTVVNDSNQ